MSPALEHYLGEYDRALAFDPALARRVREEVGAHIEEAIDHGRTAEEAIARFGRASALAPDFARAALPARLRATLHAALSMLAATFLFMRLRSVLLALGQAEGGLANLLAAVDRAGLAAAILFGLAAWHRIRKGDAVRASAPLLGAAASLLLSVAASLARAAGVAGGDPLIWATGAAEIMLIALFLRHVGRLHRHARLTAA